MQENSKGILLIVIAMTIFSVQDVFIKLLSDDISLFQILFFRSTIGALLIILYLKKSGRVIKLGSAYPFLSTCRGLLFFSGYSVFYFAQSKVPIANATVLFLVSPFFITIMSIFVFGSRIGFSRFVTMIIGFLGVILIAQPQVGQFNLYYLLPVFAALTYSISMMIAKKTADKDTVFQQIIFMYMVTALLSGVLGLSIGDGRFDIPEISQIQFMTRAWNFTSLSIIMMLTVIAIIGTLAFLLLTSAYRIADPATITPFEYSGLISSILFGYVFWGDIPLVNETAGMALIVGSGIYLFYRENLKNQHAATDSPLR